MAAQERSPVEADTPVATPLPLRTGVMSRRVLVLGGFWSGLFLALAGLAGPSLDFIWPRKLGAFGMPHAVPASEVPKAGADPVRFPTGRFYLAHLDSGQEGSAGGLLALYQKCPHLGCTVPWRRDFQFGGRPGWFRCPCHGSTYTRGAGILVFGPAPRSLDTMKVEVKENGDIVVNTGEITKGGPDNPSRAVPYRE